MYLGPVSRTSLGLALTMMLTRVLSLLPLATLALALSTHGKGVLRKAQTLPATIVNPTALKELEKNITAYTVPANYGSASFNQVRALYPGAVGL